MTFLKFGHFFISALCLTLSLVSASSASTTIEHAQIMLNALGYKAGTPDGISGTRTKAAFQEFIAENGLRADQVDFDVLEQLYDRYVEQTGQTVFDIMEKPESLLSGRVTVFPDSPFGSISALREARTAAPYLSSMYYCSTAEASLYKVNSDIGILMGFIKPERGGYKTVASDRANWSSNGMTARGTYSENLQILAMDVLLNDRESSKDVLLDILIRYAEADAFSWYSGSKSSNVLYNDTYGLKTVFTPTIAAWSVLKNTSDNLTLSEKALIDAWIWRVMNRVDHIHQKKPKLAGNRNNQRYMLALNLIQLGLLYKSEYYVHRALLEASQVKEEQRPDGSLPLETARGKDSLGYTGHATVSLMGLAEYSSLLGFDLYENQETNFKNVFNFFALASKDQSLIEAYARVKQKELKSWRYGGMSQFCERYPTTDGCWSTGNFTRYDKANAYAKLELNMGYNGMMNVCVNGLLWQANSRP